MKLGVQVVLNQLNVDEKLAKVRELGFDYFQLCVWNQSFLNADVAKQVLEACDKYSLKISSLWCGWSGPAVWNFTEGPITLGLVPPEYRFQRMNELMRGSDFAKMIKVDKMVTHVGFVPENLTDPNYLPVLSAIKTVASYCKKNGQCFLFETGQETPITLLRAIEDIGTGNCGINLDTGNLICYGKANPVDAIKIFGQYVRCTHLKDCVWPKSGRKLGGERKLGEGDVDFPEVIRLLNEHKYKGHFTIEREIEGPQQNADILEAATFIRAEAAKYDWDFKDEE
jgi:sugar phosphate isomerase/epimerase